MQEPDRQNTPANRGRIVYLLRTGRARLNDSLREGECPSDFLYGFASLKQLAPDAGLEEFGPSELSVCWRWVFRLIERGIEPLLLCRLWLERAWWAMRQIRQNDVVVTNIDSIGLSMAAVCSVLARRPRLLHISQGLTNALEDCSSISLWNALRRAITAQLCNVFDRIVVLGEGAKASYLKHQLVIPSKLSCVQFGVDVDFWRPTQFEHSTVQAEEPFLLSVGSDDGRDYETLLQCRFPCKMILVSRKELPAHEQVEQRSKISDVELRELYQRASFVVIPLRDIPQPSGQSASLQAMACGKAVIVTRTQGFWDPQGLGEDVHLRSVIPADSNVLEHEIWKLFNDAESIKRLGINARKHVEEHYAEGEFALRLWSLCRRELSSVAMVRV